MKFKYTYLIPFYGFYKMIKDNPNGTDELWGAGVPFLNLLYGMILSGIILLIIGAN